MVMSHFTPKITDDLVRVHEQYLVPAIYAQWAGRVAEIAEIEFGQHVLDVACGTGTLSRAAKLETGLAGQVIGLDISEKMLESAQRKAPGIDWQIGDATSMPFEKNQFDRVLCQFSLMFIDNRVAAIKDDAVIGNNNERVLIEDIKIVEVRRFAAGKTGLLVLGPPVLIVGAIVIWFACCFTF